MKAFLVGIGLVLFAIAALHGGSVPGGLLLLLVAAGAFFWAIPTGDIAGFNLDLDDDDDADPVEAATSQAQALAAQARASAEQRAATTQATVADMLKQAEARIKTQSQRDGWE